MTDDDDLGGQRSVLLVEDDDDVADLVAEMLSHLGYRALRADCAASALGALEDGKRVHVVFSDIMMPGEMNGVDLAREIRRLHPELPIVLTSGYAEAFRNEARMEELIVLAKPYELKDLAEVLGQAVNSRLH